MNTPYAPYMIESDGHFYPYSNEQLARIHVIENTRMGFPPDGIWKLEPDGYGYRYSQVDVNELLPPAGDTVTEIGSLVA